MKFHTIGKQPSRAVSVPPLAGGINTRDAVNRINDNQLTESFNMWYRDGRLKTRCGMKTEAHLAFLLGESYKDSSFSVRPLDIYKTTKGISSRLIMYYTEDNALYTTHCHFKWVSAEGYTNVPTLTVEYIAENVFCVQSKNAIYTFICGDGNYDIYKLDEEEEEPLWALLNESNYDEAPVIIAHAVSDEVGAVSGVQLDGYNLLGGYAKCIMSSVNKNIFFDGYHEMTYGIPYPAGTELKKLQGQKVIVEHTTLNGTKVKHEVVLDSEGKGYEGGGTEGAYIFGDDFLSLVVNGRTFHFMGVPNLDNGEIAIAKVDAGDYVEDNLTITFPTIVTREQKDKVFRCTQNEWFGGASAGIAGGTRLFLGGNQKEGEQSLMLWSSLDNPLYFPENCYAYVGNNGSAVTGFGKQSDMLVVFKKYETFYTTYHTTNISADALINQSVVDYSANSVFFPLVQIHSGIGCDLPNTIQLCRNRLVWTNKNGRTYSLVTNSQYSERNIYCVSEMLERNLAKESNLAEAVACDWQGYYLLFCKNRVYLMDYNSYGYQYLYSFSKNEDANIRIPWYIWRLPSEYSSMSAFTISDKLACFAIQTSAALAGKNPHAVIFYADEDYRYDDNLDYSIGEPDFGKTAIPCKAVTKAFDFSAPNYRKNIISVGLQVAENAESPMTVKFCTDDGNEEYIIEVMGAGADDRDIEYEKSIILNPAMRNIIRFAISFESEGYMALGGITLIYRLLGGAR